MTEENEDKKISEIAEKALEECIGLKEEEQVLVITDESRQEIGEAFYRASGEKTWERYLLKVKEQEQGELKAPELAEHLMKKSPDVIIIPTRNSYTHMKAREKATEKGARVATLPGITKETFRRTIDIDYKGMRKEAEKLTEKMKKAERVKIETNSGTNLTLKIPNEIGKDLGRMKNPGEYGNLPSGEIYTAPEEANGKLVIDSMQEIAKPKTTVYIQNGETREVEGDREFKKKLWKYKNGRKIAEFGIGMNPKATITSNTLEDEKVKGTCHIAFGKNIDFGGDIDSDIHWDAILFQPTLKLDNKKIMDTGKLLI
ncbi:MAG: aminopeptidase [archaeon]